MRRITKLLGILLVLGLLVSLVPMVVAAASSTTTKAPGTWVSSINIQNPDDAGNEAANVTINFYNSEGVLALAFAVTPAIADGGSRSLFVPTDVAGLADGQYSAVIQS
ncbi:MAG: hypothetical protein ACUVWR_16910, partial [Anaerolineae bacterium]